MKENKKTNLTITIAKQNFEKLKNLVSTGKVSELVNKLIEEWIEKEEKKIANDYQTTIKSKACEKQWESWILLHRKKINEKNDEN